MNVPFVDPKKQYLATKAEMDTAIQEVIDSTAFIGGGTVRSFEETFADYPGARYCTGCGNGTDSLEMLLCACEIGAGDEVIVPANFWISTSEVVSGARATSVFVDPDPVSYTIDASRIEEKTTSKTRAIIPMHLYGLPAEMDEIMAIAQKYHYQIEGHSSTNRRPAIHDSRFRIAGSL